MTTLPPPTQAVLDKNGRMNEVWYRYMRGSDTSATGSGSFLGFRTTAPSAITVGDQYVNPTDGHLYQWDGTAWVDTLIVVTVF